MTETVLISRVEAKEGNKPFKVFDGNDVQYVTWDDALGAKVTGMVGQRVGLIVELREKQKDGRTFTDRLLKGVEEAAQPAPANASEFEPNINTAKQVVIIRQSSWNQANQIYATAAELYRNAHPATEVVMESVHAIAWKLFTATPRPENSTMRTLALEIEKAVRADYFPMADAEIPF